MAEEVSRVFTSTELRGYATHILSPLQPPARTKTSNASAKFTSSDPLLGSALHANEDDVEIAT